MALQFPTNPTSGQTYQSGSSATYQYNGTYWTVVIPQTQILATATSASFANTSTSSSFALTSTSASFTTTASFASTANTASFIATASRAISSSVATSASQAITSSFSQNRTPTILAWGASLGSPTVTSGTLYNNATYINNDGGVRLTTTAIGSNGTIYWNLTGSNGFDFKRDFRATISTYYSGTYGGAANGDGHFFNFGGTGSSATTYNIADSSLTFTYDPYVSQTSSFVQVNGVQVGRQSMISGANINSNWVIWTIEVRQSLFTGKRILTARFDNERQIEADVTSWSPSGSIFTVGAWCGGATAEQWTNYILLEQI